MHADVEKKVHTQFEVSVVAQTPPQNIPAQALKSRQIVEQEKDPTAQDSPKKTQLLGKDDQFHKKQTIAKRRGENSKDSSQSLNLDKDSAGQEIQLKKTKKSHSVSQNAASLDYIKSLDQDLETKLSTKKFEFYSYYAQIRPKLNRFWATKVKEKITKIYSQGRDIASEGDMASKILVTLNRKGQLLKVQVIGYSAYRELDEAAAEAFRLAAPFPAPPSGMADEDGNITIRWDFVLEG